MVDVKQSSATKPVVIRISPMSHFAVGFLALGLLALVLTHPALFAPLLIIPIGLSYVIVRYRTVADTETVTARSLVSSVTVPWNEIEGLKFEKSAWAVAHLTDGSDVRLPAVTFSTLPLLTDVSGGRVPNPYA